MAKELKELTKRSENYSQWYNDLVVKADLAEQSPVRGCMVINLTAMQSGKRCSVSWTICSSNRTRQRLFPAADSEIILEPGSRTRGRICQGMCRSDSLPSEKCRRRFWSDCRPCSQTGRRADYPSYFGNHYLEYL